MQPIAPSRTALRVALRRAAHQLHDAKPLVLDDPVAVRILGPNYAAELARTPAKPDRPHSHALRAFIVSRSRFAEDKLAEAVRAGTTQYVLLGAGLDTFAHRCPHPQLRIFEVDHPATQQWKRTLLKSNSISEPEGLHYVPVDFERESLRAQLSQAGFDSAQQTLFAWLGVVPYLTLAAFRSTLGVIAAQPRGSAVVLDYGQPRHVLPPLEQLAHDSLASRVALAGEPFQLFLTVAQMRRELAAFIEVEDLGREEINERYFRNRSDHLRLLGTAGRLVHAKL